MSLKNSLINSAWKLKLLNKKLKLNVSYFKFSILKKLLPKRISSPDLSNIKKILIVRNDKHGDMIVTTGFFRELAKAGYEVYVSSEKSSLDIIKLNPYIKGTFVYKDKSLKELYYSIKNIRKERFDAVIDLKYCRSVYKKNIFFCSFVKSPILIGFNKSNIISYNISLPYYELSAHVTTRIPPLLALLNIENFNLNYEIFTPRESEDKARLFIKNKLNTKKKIAVINPLGGHKSRWLTQSQLDDTIALLDPQYQVILIGQLTQLQRLSWPESVHLFQSKNILDIVPIIEKADLIFTVDTSVVHIATTFSKKTIALYLDHANAPIANESKATYNKQTLLYNTHLLDLLSDAPFIKNNTYDKRVPINHLNWSPNNHNAHPIIFKHRHFADIPSSEFNSKIMHIIASI